MSWLLSISYALGIGFEAILLLTLINGSGRTYAAMIVYCAFLLISTLSDVSMWFLVGRRTFAYFHYVWTAEFIRQTCQLGFVITLVSQALPPGRQRATIMRAVVVGTAAVVVGSLMIYQDPLISTWLSKVIRNVSFTAALINLVLWFALVASKNRDTRLLMISGGLGIQMTGDAVTQSLKQFHFTIPIADFVGAGSFFLCLFIWWQAFREKPELTPAPPNQAPTQEPL
jgi:hypothetical protein